MGRGRPPVSPSKTKKAVRKAQLRAARSRCAAKRASKRVRETPQKKKVSHRNNSMHCKKYRDKHREIHETPPSLDHETPPLVSQSARTQRRQAARIAEDLEKLGPRAQQLLLSRNNVQAIVTRQEEPTWQTQLADSFLKAVEVCALTLTCSLLLCVFAASVVPYYLTTLLPYSCHQAMREEAQTGVARVLEVAAANAPNSVLQSQFNLSKSTAKRRKIERQGHLWTPTTRATRCDKFLLFAVCCLCA